MITKDEEECPCGNSGPLMEYDGEYLCSDCIKEAKRDWEAENKAEVESAWDAYNGYGDSDGSSDGDWIND